LKNFKAISLELQTDQKSYEESKQAKFFINGLYHLKRFRAIPP